MVRQGKELRGSFISARHDAGYLPAADKYIFSSEEPEYKFNIIGSGMMGLEHMKVTALEGRGTIHGVYDVSPSSVEATERVFPSIFPGRDLIRYDSLDAACNDPEVDGLIIGTPNYTHIDIVREAIKSGKHILLEKPMATTLRDAYDIMQIAEDYEAVFQIGLQYRHKAIYAEAIHEALERRAVGDIKTLSISEHRIPFLDKVKQWNKFSEYSGGTLVEKCCHYFDLLNLFAHSRPKDVYATGGMDVNFVNFEYEASTSDIVDNALVTVTYENSIRTSFNLCMFSPMFYEELTICGDEGRLNAYENEDYVPIERPATHLEVLCNEEKASKVCTPCYPTSIQQSGHSGATYYEHKYFIDNIEGKKTSTATVGEGFWSIVVGIAAEESIKRGRIINIAELLEKNDIFL